MASATNRISCGIQQLLERLHLVHQLVVDVQTAGGVDDQHIAAAVDGFAARFLGQALDGGRVGFADLAFVDVGLDRLRHDLQLLARGGAIDVDRDQQRTVSAVLQPVGQLAGGGGLTGTLQAGHQDDGRRLRGELQLGGVFAKNLDQFVADDLDDLLAGRQRGQHFLAHRFRLDVVDELL